MACLLGQLWLLFPMAGILLLHNVSGQQPVGDMSSNITGDGNSSIDNNGSRNDNYNNSNSYNYNSSSCPIGCRCNNQLLEICCSNLSTHLNDSSLTFNDLPSSSLWQRLDLSHNDIRYIDQDTFTGFTELQSLNLQSNQLEPEATFIAISILSELLSLDLSFNNLSEFDADSTGQVSWSRHLDLGYNQLNSMPRVLEAFPRLTMLQLQHNHIENLNVDQEQPPQQYNHTTNNSNSFHEQLQYNQSVSNQSVSNKSSILYLPLQPAPGPSVYPQLHTLSLRANRLSHIDLTAFPGLLTLDLSHNQLSTVRGICSRSTQLRNLTLSYNPIRYLADNALSGCGRLRHLSLSHLLQLSYVNSESLSGLGSLLTLQFDHCPALNYIHATAFSQLTSLHSLDLSYSSLSSLHEELFTGLSSIRSIHLHRVELLTCSCDLLWLPGWFNRSIIAPVDLQCLWHDQAYKVRTLSSELLNCTEARILTEYNNTIFVKMGVEVVLDCVVSGEPTPHVTWITKFKRKLTYHPAFIDRANSDTANLSYIPTDGCQTPTVVAEQVRVLPNGSLYISCMSRQLAGYYRCLAHNEFGNQSVLLKVRLDYMVLTQTMIWSTVVGALCATTFLIVGLAAGMIRHFTHFCSRAEKEKRHRIRELIETIQEYKTEKVGTFRAYKSAKLDQISAFKNHKIHKLRTYKQATVTTILNQMHAMREHYQGQMGKVKENYTMQVEKLHDNYGVQRDKFKDYRSEKLDRVRDQYQLQAIRIRDYGTSQMQRLREQYRVQQQYMLKLLELLDIGNCMSVIEAECMRTESMLFDPDLTTLQLEAHAVHVMLQQPPSDMDSEYVTAGSESDALSSASVGVRKNRQHKRCSMDSSSSGSSTSVESRFEFGMAMRLGKLWPRRKKPRRLQKTHNAQMHSEPVQTEGNDGADEESEQEEEQDQQQSMERRESVSSEYESVAQSRDVSCEPVAECVVLVVEDEMSVC